ncbi:hypothetical protein SVIOM342S_05910 [Streptomyces violaceorubidus]
MALPPFRPGARAPVPQDCLTESPGDPTRRWSAAGQPQGAGRETKSPPGAEAGAQGARLLGRPRQTDGRAQGSRRRSSPRVRGGAPRGWTPGPTETDRRAGEGEQETKSPPGPRRSPTRLDPWADRDRRTDGRRGAGDEVPTGSEAEPHEAGPLGRPRQTDGWAKGSRRRSPREAGGGAPGGSAPWPTETGGRKGCRGTKSPPGSGAEPQGAGLPGRPTGGRTRRKRRRLTPGPPAPPTPACPRHPAYARRPSPGTAAAR